MTGPAAGWPGPAGRGVVRPVGEHALLVEFGSGAEALALHAELDRRRAAGTFTARDVVPAARTVLIDGVAAPERLAAELADWPLPELTPGAGPLVEIPVRYDGPDLADVAALWGVSPDEAARIHAEPEYRVAFCGFSPGFGYLTGLADRYAVPRRATPRTRVPAGSVALAGTYAGVYPSASPGGWQLVGSTDAVLWDPAREPAALLAPGVRVRFVPAPEPGRDRAGTGRSGTDRAGTGPGSAGTEGTGTEGAG